MSTIETYKLHRKDSELFYTAPDRSTYSIDLDEAKIGEWLVVEDGDDKGVIALLKENDGFDATLILSLDKACSWAATLLHEEDDSADTVYYYATDMGNSTELKRPAFILRAQGLSECPVAKWKRFRIMCVK